VNQYLLTPDGTGGWELHQADELLCAWNAAFPLPVVQRLAALRVTHDLGRRVAGWHTADDPGTGQTRYRPVAT